MKPILSIMHDEDPWSIFRFFTTPAEAFGGETPLDMLRKGKAAQVMKAAENFVDRP